VSLAFGRIEKFGQASCFRKAHFIWLAYARISRPTPRFDACLFMHHANAIGLGTAVRRWSHSQSAHSAPAAGGHTALLQWQGTGT
jgi:hypothetical protein